MASRAVGGKAELLVSNSPRRTAFRCCRNGAVEAR